MNTSKQPTLFITGLGWMGWHLANHFLEKSYTVSGTVSNKEKAKKLRSMGVTAYKVQLPIDPYPEVLQAVDVLIYTVPPSSGQQMSEEMIRVTLQAARQYTIDKAIYISSTSLYPENNSVVAEENAEYIPSRHTGVKMKALEDLWIESDVATTILRCGGLYGRERIPGGFLKDGVLSHPNKPVNMTHIDDVVTAVEKIIAADEFGDIYNVISVNNESREEFYSKYRDIVQIDDSSVAPYKIVSREKIAMRFNMDFGN